MQIHLLPDKSVFVQFIIFLSVLTGMVAFVFRPIVKIIKLRRERTSELLEKAAKIEIGIKNKMEEYDRRISAAKLELAEEYGKIKNEISAEEAKIKNETREESLKAYQKTVQEVAALKEQVLNDLKREIPAIADEIINKVKRGE